MEHRNLIKLNLARNCLRYIIRCFGIKEIHMPYYICPAVWQAARKENCAIKFYHIDNNFLPAREFAENDYILYPNYFGISSKNVHKLMRLYKNLIVDNAHNYFMPDCGLASFNSLRKFFNVKDGAFLYISQLSSENFPQDEYYYETCRYKTFEEFCKNELRLEHEPVKLISRCSEQLFEEIDKEQEKQRRLEIFNQLHTALHSTNKLDIKLAKEDVPFVYPYLTDDETFAAKLENNGISILRYWEAMPEYFPEYDFYKYLVPVPLDLNVLNSKNIF